LLRNARPTPITLGQPHPSERAGPPPNCGCRGLPYSFAARPSAMDLMLLKGFRLAGITRTREPVDRVDRGCGAFDAPSRAIMIR
jgi:hypothetical protein